MPQLDPTWFVSQLFWLLVSLCVLYVALSRFVLPQLMGVMEKRRAARVQDLALAESLKAQAENTRETYEQALLTARQRAQGLFTDVETAGKQATETALASLNRTQHEKLAQAEQRITRTKDELLSALTPAVSDLASLAVEKLVGKRPDDKQVKAVVQQIITDER